ncbi:MAG: M56 family metallopeptidase [Thermoleophilaceae bacterium]
MTSARRLYRLGAGIACLGAAASALATVVALRALEFNIPSPAALAAVCRDLMVPEVGAGGALVIALAGLGMVTFLLGARSLYRQLHAYRRFMATLSPGGARVVERSSVTVFEGSAPHAFCAGFLRPRIFLSRGAVERLPAAELAAVVAHERHHLGRRDPLRMLAARVLRDALFFMPILRRLERRYTALAEIAADEAAARQRSPQTLASALLAFGESRAPAGAVGIAPERVDHLLGRPPRWELPLSLLVGSLVLLGGLVAGTAAAGALVASSSLNAAMLLAQSCMLAMVALVVAGMFVALVSSRRPARRAR